MIFVALIGKFQQVPSSATGREALLFGGVTLAALLLAAILKGRRPNSGRWRRDWKARRIWPSRGELSGAGRTTQNIADPKVQLEAISFVGFETQPLLNREEVPILRLLEAEAFRLNAGFRVMAQTSLGEILRPKSGSASAAQRELAFKAINSKRLDFAVFNRFGKLILAVEYQGSGHYHRTSFMRDAVKREVLRKAEVEFLAIPADYSAREIGDRVRRTLVDHLQVIDRGVAPKADPAAVSGKPDLPSLQEG